MKIIGLTGPSGSGKSYCGQALAAHEIPTINADDVYHALISSDTPCAREIAETFGNEILYKDRSVNRKALAAIVFADQGGDAISRLNAITHKYVREETLSRIKTYKAEGVRAVTVDAPLLFEARFDEFCDFSIAVIAPVELRLSRIMERDGITESQARARIAAQPEIGYYLNRADYVIVNDSTPQQLWNSVVEILKKESIIS